MSVTTETALATTEAQTGEIAVSAQEAMAIKEVEAAIIVAQKFPRNEEAAFGRVMKSCERWSFATLARYSFPRGGTQIEGPSVNLAREIARCWGNIRYGVDVIHDDDDSRTIRAWAWDVQTNTRRSQDTTFKKLVYRKKGGWKKPDERDLRELSNKHGETAVRNCLLHLVPPDLVEDAMTAAKETLNRDASANPEEARKRLIRGFQGIGVTVEDLELYLDHPVRQVTPEEIADLRGIWKSISDGNSVWAEYVRDKQPTQDPDAAPVTVDDLLGTSGQGATEPPTERREPSEDSLAAEFDIALAATTGIREVDALVKTWAPRFTGRTDWLKNEARHRKEEIRAARGQASSKPKPDDTDTSELTDAQLDAKAATYDRRLRQASSGSSLESVWSDIDSDPNLREADKLGLRKVYEERRGKLG